jgi:hypothetical protein
MFSDLFWAIYWIDVLSSMPESIVGGGFVGLVFGGVIAGVGYHKTYALPDTTISDADVIAWKWGIRAFFAGVAFCIALAFIPAKSTMYMMLGVKTTENVVESPLGKKLQQIVDAEVDGYLKKLQPNNKE